MIRIKGSVVTRRTSRTNTDANHAAMVEPSIQEFSWLKYGRGQAAAGGRKHSSRAALPIMDIGSLCEPSAFTHNTAVTQFFARMVFEPREYRRSRSET